VKIEHIAVWVSDLEQTRDFYEKYFGAHSNAKYVNDQKGFSSYFLSFEGGARLEIMKRLDVKRKEITSLGWAHIALSMGSKRNVDDLTDRLRVEGYKVVGEPRTTGDGYYESVVEDPDGNLIELTV